MNQSQTLEPIAEEKEMIITPNLLGLAKAYWSLKCFRAGLKRRSIEVGNGTISCWAGGNNSGDPLLMLQGAGPNSPADWHMQVSAMTREFYVVMPDLMWFGDSVARTEDYTPDFQAEAMEQLLDILGVDEFHVMGHSYGGILASMLASQLSDRVKKVVAVDSLAAPCPEWGQIRQRILKTAGVQRISELIVPEDGTAMKRLYRVSSHRQMRIPTFIFNWLHKEYHMNVRQRTAMIDYVEQNGDNLFRNSGFNIAQDTLLIYGEYDVITPIELGQYATKIIGSNARLEVFADTAHCPNREKAKKFNRTVLDFLNS